MTHSIVKQKSFFMILIVLLATLVLTMAQPAQAEWVGGGHSTASFTVDIDQEKPGLPGGNTGGVDQPDIPNNGQEIHYTASGKADANGYNRLPQTGVLKSSLLSVLGLVMILLVIIWRRQRRETKEAGYYED